MFQQIFLAFLQVTLMFSIILILRYNVARGGGLSPPPLLLMMAFCCGAGGGSLVGGWGVRVEGAVGTYNHYIFNGG
jgi:hypothetical protein